ncbi:unnamed protein product [Bursaphelenchus xylophilus]|uniref:(pine wood nematode) hypothetical protein n=1 Tax=Bursaphelenchus xylophilus TaxID=6326 RepID=A0A1I7RSP3_BURXY|nr:unnamed protein product [Bursaphelenchus xylophilus]CAG9122848.1 unnamed protein product [Bursaphelenchus xylophilus]
MDPSDPNFDPLRLLQCEDAGVPLSYKCFDSIDEWEEDCKHRYKELATQLKNYDLGLEKSLRPVAMGINARIRKMRTENKKNIVKEWENRLLGRGVVHILNVGFACNFRKAHEKILIWMKDQARVSIKLSPQGKNTTFNRLIQGVIISFDASWNLLLRDVDEVYRPESGSPISRPNETAYKNLGNGLYRRSLGCFLVVGKQIVCIYVP